MKRTTMFFFVTLAAAGMLAVGGATVQASPGTAPEAARELLAEEAETVSEAREESDAAEFDALASEADPSYLARIERIQLRIAQLAAERAAIWELPHPYSTLRFRVNRRHKHFRIMLARKEIQLLRDRERLRVDVDAAKEQLLAAKQAGNEEGLAREQVLLEQRQAELREVTERFARRKEALRERLREIHA